MVPLLFPMLCAVGCGYSMGRVPPVVSAVDLQPVWVAQADPTLGPALEEALGDALARRVAVGVGPEVVARVSSFEAGPVGSGGDQWRVALAFTLELDGIGCVRESGVRTFAGGGQEAVAAGRVAAVHALGESLAESAVARLLSGEGGKTCP